MAYREKEPECVVAGLDHAWRIDTPEDGRERATCALCGLHRVTGLIVTYWRAARSLAIAGE